MTVINGKYDRDEDRQCSFCGEGMERGAEWRLHSGEVLSVCTVCAYRCLPRIVADGMAATGYQWWDVESKVLREFFRGYILAIDGERRDRMERLRKARSTGDTTSSPPEPNGDIDRLIDEAYRCDTCGQVSCFTDGAWECACNNADRQ